MSNIDRGKYATEVAQDPSQPGQWASGLSLLIETDNPPVGLLLRWIATRGSLSLAIQTIQKPGSKTSGILVIWVPEKLSAWSPNHWNLIKQRGKITGVCDSRLLPPI